MYDCMTSIHELQKLMALVNDKLFQMRTNDEFLRRVDDWRRAQEDLPSRTEAIRRLVELGLKASIEQAK
jgi:hypothetical protein